MKRLVGERKALAAAVLAFYGFLYTLIAMAGAAAGLGRVVAALAGVYGLAFFALVAGYFWARWYAVGVGLSGVIIAVVGMWQVGTDPPMGTILMFFGGTHLAATMALWGSAMAQPYD